MAVVIREGGKNPMTVVTWRDYVKLSLLEGLYDRCGSAHQGDILMPLLYPAESNFVQARWGRALTLEDLKAVLEECLGEGLVKREVGPLLRGCGEPILTLVLTQAGYELIPEHIFP